MVLRGGHVVDPLNRINRISDLAIRDDHIEATGTELDVYKAEQVIDARGKLVLPGVIDSHAHLVRPGSRGAAYSMLLKAGVTTAAAFAGPVATVRKEIMEKGNGLNVIVLEGLYPGHGFSSEDPSPSEISTAVSRALDEGALGIKILGGHYPLTPESIALMIQEASRQSCYVAIHAGSTTEGSDIRGFEQAVELADGLPLHVAHINSYCRGNVESPLLEVERALSLLDSSPNIISESYLAANNGTNASLDEDGLPVSHVTRTCLRKGNYSPDKAGLEKAIRDGYAKIYALLGGEMVYLSREDGLEYWKEHLFDSKCSFAVNVPLSLVACATSKDGDGRFIIPAISSDGGGIPRNVILSNGIKLVKMEYLTISELVEKSSLAPARMFGLKDKGHLSAGADADVVVVDPETGRVCITIVAGKIRMASGSVFGGSGVILTGSRGRRDLEREGVPCREVDLSESTFIRGR